MVERIVENNGGVSAGRPQRRRHNIDELRTARGNRDAAQRTDPVVRAGKDVQLHRRMVHLKCNHLEQVQHCTNLPLQVTLPAYIEQEKIGPGFSRMLPLIENRIRMEEQGRQQKIKRQSILESA